MTRAAAYYPVNAIGNGVTTVIPFDWPLISASELIVTQINTMGEVTLLELNAGYTLTINGTRGGNITLALAAPTGTTTNLRRVRSLTQDTSFRGQGAFFPEMHEDALDKLTDIAVQQQEQLNRSLTLPVGSTADTELPSAAEGTVLGWVGGKLRNLAAGTALLASNLLSSGLALGDALITVLLPAAGAQPRTQHDVNQDLISVFNWMTPEQIAAVRSRALLVDVSQAVQAAINSGYKRILFPWGSYLLEDGLTVNVNGLEFVGDGPYGTILKYTGLTGAAITLASAASIGTFSMRNMRITGRSLAGDSAAGIVLGSIGFFTAEITLSNVWVNFFTNNAGLRVQNAWWITITNNCRIENNLWGVHLPTTAICTTLDITGNTKLRGGDVGLLCESTTSSAVDGITLRHVSVETTQKEGIRVNSPKVTVNLQDCYFEVCGQDPSSTGSIYVASSVATANEHATLNMDRVLFHSTINGPDLNLGLNCHAVVRDCDGMNTISTLASTVAHFERNRGHGPNPRIPNYAALLGSISAFEYDANNLPVHYSKGLGYLQGDKVFLDAHVLTAQTVAPVLTVDTAAGTSATATLTAGSTDNSGQIRLTMGSGSWGTGQQCHLAFGKTYGTAPRVVITPANAKAAGQAVSCKSYVDEYATVFYLDFVAADTSAGLALWNYHVIGQG